MDAAIIGGLPGHSAHAQPHKAAASAPWPRGVAPTCSGVLVPAGGRWHAEVLRNWPRVAEILARLSAPCRIPNLGPAGRCRLGPGSTHAAKTGATLDAIIETLSRTEPVIWGGDWNHALSGRECAGSAAGRAHLRPA